MQNDLKQKRLFYGRLIVSVSLYCAFLISSVMETLTRTTEPPSLIIGGLLIGAVLILPRSTRRMQRSEGAGADPTSAEQLQRIHKWLTGVRLIYLLGALIVWVVLPAII
ncbi:hypothetical protein DFR33_110137 [Bradymonas sediminis]|nr:hypothetical protein DFR33_110137 [Bradymonas sediminis]